MIFSISKNLIENENIHLKLWKKCTHWPLKFGKPPKSKTIKEDSKDSKKIYEAWLISVLETNSASQRVIDGLIISEFWGKCYKDWLVEGHPWQLRAQTAHYLFVTTVQRKKTSR